MKLASWINTDGHERMGFFIRSNYFEGYKSGQHFGLQFPKTMKDFLENTEENLEVAKKLSKQIEHAHELEAAALKKLLSPIPFPSSCRDGYAFRQHVQTMRRNRGAEMIEEFDSFPVFYFTNHQSIIGEGPLQVQPDHLDKLDYELEVAIVIGKPGKNISASRADEYILGYSIMNDFSARTLQMEEMKLSLGPAKGKDFATALGPWIVTPDELADRSRQTDHGLTYDLKMTCSVNGNCLSSGNLSTMNWTFAQIIERASYGTMLYAGDVIGSGTVGTGCLAELNGTAALQSKESGKAFSPQWLKDGDVVEMSVEKLGSLKNTVQVEAAPYSILAYMKK